MKSPHRAIRRTIPSRRAPRQVLRGAACTSALVALALVPAACGSSSPSSGDSPSSKSGDASASENGLKFSRCMREHGVKDFPNPETSGGLTRLRYRAKPGEGASPQTMEAAQNACKAYAPGAGAQAHQSPQEKVEREEQVAKFARCMREHGIHVETSTQGGGIRIGIHHSSGEAGPNPESPAFQAAQKACQGLLPAPKGGGPGGHGGPATGTASGGPNGPNVQAGG